MILASLRMARLKKWALGMEEFDNWPWVSFDGDREVSLDGEFTLEQLRQLVAIWETVNEGALELPATDLGPGLLAPKVEDPA